MNEFLPRIEPAASVGSATERKISGVRAVTPVSQATSRTDAATGSLSPRPVAGQGVTPVIPADDAARAAADYARVQARVATVVADLAAQARPPRADAVEKADNALMALMPQPVVVLPLPPANQDVREFVAQVTQSIARQAAQARAAQSNLSPATVDAAVA
jgi:hypothetical protein